MSDLLIFLMYLIGIPIALILLFILFIFILLVAGIFVGNSIVKTAIKEGVK